MMKRRSGVLMHVSSLWGEYSTGAFGTQAREWIDFLAECGFGVWQVLPFNLPDEWHSPYRSYGAFSLHPWLIDLPSLFRRELLTRAELDGARQRIPFSCEFERLERERMLLLRRAAGRFRDWDAVEDFLHSHPQTAAFCRFMALRSANGDRPWREWHTDSPEPELLRTWQFLQYEFFREWAEVKRYAGQRGISVIGDLPFYVAYESADVWANRGQFELDEQGLPARVAGVPPDDFCADGQLWGNPLYRWDVMHADGYLWWRERMRLMTELFDGVRIDHFRGLEAYYAIPANAETARAGEWLPGPGMDWVRAIRPICRGKQMIAEDLGEVTPQVRRLVRQSGFPGMRVLQFGSPGRGDPFHLPHSYVQGCVAYTGTHDNNTLLGYIWELEAEARRDLLAYFGCKDTDWDSCCTAILRTVLASHAGLVMLPAQDLLRFGSDTRLNVPGRREGNWGWRMTAEQLGRLNRTQLRRWNRLYGRAD